MSEGIPHKLVVSSSRLTVDTEELAYACVRIRNQQDILSQILLTLESARDKAQRWSFLTPAESGYLTQCLEGIKTSIADISSRLDGFTQHLSFAALIYASAENSAQKFEDVWRILNPEAFNTWNTGPGTIHFSDRVNSLIDRLGYTWIPQNLINYTTFPRSATFTGYTQLGRAAAEFATGRGDGYVGLRSQFDIDSMSRRILNGTWTWWGNPPGADAPGTRGAAALLASWSAGIGTLTSWGKRRVQVSAQGAADSGGVPPKITTYTQARATPSIGGITVPAGDSSGVFPLLSTVGTAASSLSQTPIFHHRERPSSSAGPSRPHPALRGQPSGTPLKTSELLGELTGLREGGHEGQLKILQHDTVTSTGEHRRSWSVVIRGTQKWSVGGSNPQDMLSNFQAIAGVDSEQEAAVRQAMDMAGIHKGEPVEIVGHSQGGIIAASLASDPQITQKYDIASVLTAGAPVSGFSTDPSVHMLALENTRDIVPALDGQANTHESNCVTVSFDGNELGVTEGDGRPKFAHDIGVYRTVMERIEAEGAQNTSRNRIQEVLQWEQHRKSTLGIASHTQTTTHIFDTQRVR